MRFTLHVCEEILVLQIFHIKKYPNANARQSEGNKAEMQSKSKGQNEQLPVSPFQRDTMQTKSMQEEAQGNGVV